MISHYTKEDIVEALHLVNVEEGDTIFIHSNIGFFGVLSEADSAKDYCNLFLESIFKVIGRNGTLVVPTFSYSFCNGLPFEKDKTPGVCGLLSEAVRTDPRALRSDDANFSVAAIGRLAEHFTLGAPAHSFGPDSFWDRFLNAEGKFVNFNFDAGSTFIHYVEKCLNVPYRYDKPFTGVSIDGAKHMQKTFYHYVYDLNKPENAPDFSKFHRNADEAGLIRKKNLGRGQIVMITAQDAFELIKNEMSKDPRFLLRDKESF